MENPYRPPFANFPSTKFFSDDRRKTNKTKKERKKEKREKKKKKERQETSNSVSRYQTEISLWIDDIYAPHFDNKFPSAN